MSSPPASQVVEIAPPSATEAEQAVLGAILMDPDVLNQVKFLDRAAFFLERHRMIYSAMLAIRGRDMPLDHVTLVEELRARGQLEDIGGQPYLVGLVTSTPSALNAVGYARLVEHTYTRRRLLETASTLARLAHSDDTPVEAALDRAIRAVEEVRAAHDTTVDRARPVDEAVSELCDDILLWKATPRDVAGWGAGEEMEPLTRAVGGWSPARLALLAGLPRSGKSALLGQLAAGLAGAGHPVLMFSLEMPARDMLLRMVSQRARVPVQTIRTGRYQDGGWERVQQAVDALRALRGRLFIVETAGLTVPRMEAIASIYARKHGVQVAIVDTMNRVVADGRDQYHRMTAASHGLADWAHNSGLLVLAAAQLNRGVFTERDRRPREHHLRDSGALMEDADLVLALHRPALVDESNNSDEAWVYTLKNRHGDGDADVRFVWDAPCTAFRRANAATINLEEV